MKYIFTILTLFYSIANAQDSLFWTRPAYTTCLVQQSPDNYTWRTINEVTASDTNYAAPIPGPTYYYRVLAGQDTSVCVQVYNVLSISYDSIFHPAPKLKEFKVKVVGDRIEIESMRDEVCSIGFYSITGQLLRLTQAFLKRGLNTYYLPPPVAHGLYILQVKSAYNSITKKVVK
ncbi:MAG: T9SS type A sorting domain-containing protein [Bacteroidota bacterium]|nr:T9SS type A sorting domain-containing protein [Bacteroidota bacterium]